MIAEAKSRKLDVTTECYPYIAGMTDIKSAIFDEGWQEVFGIDYKDLQWAATGERLTKETFAKYRQTGGMVAVFSMTEEVVTAAIKSPLTIIASDGILENGKGHPRTAGTYSRILIPHPDIKRTGRASRGADWTIAIGPRADART